MGTRVLQGLTALVAVLLVAACGGGGSGGGGGGTAPGAPALILTPEAIKTFAFSWDAVDTTTEYRLLENPDGVSGYSQVASIAATETAHDLEVLLPARINASYILQTCNAAGCTGSSEVFVRGTLAEAVGYVKASNTGRSDRFGGSLALSADGETLAVGAHFEDSAATGINGNQADSLAMNAGAVYLY